MKWMHLQKYLKDWGPLTLLYSDHCIRALLKLKVDAFYSCRTEIPFSHFRIEEKRLFAYEKEMGLAQLKRVLVYLLGTNILEG